VVPRCRLFFLKKDGSAPARRRNRSRAVNDERSVDGARCVFSRARARRGGRTRRRTSGLTTLDDLFFEKNATTQGDAARTDVSSNDEKVCERASAEMRDDAGVDERGDD